MFYELRRHQISNIICIKKTIFVSLPGTITVTDEDNSNGRHFTTGKAVTGSELIFVWLHHVYSSQ